MSANRYEQKVVSSKLNDSKSLGKLNNAAILLHILVHTVSMEEGAESQCKSV